MAKKNVPKNNKKEKKENSNKYLTITIAIILLGAISVIIFKGTPDNEIKVYSGNITDIKYGDNGEIVGYKYNNFDFEKKDKVWYMMVQRGDTPLIVSLTYGPINTEDIKIDFQPNDFERLTKPLSKVYVTFDHDSPNGSYIVVSAINLVSNMKSGWMINSSRACLKNSSSCQDVPIVTCSSHPKNAVIQLVESEETKVNYKDNCLTIAASGEDFIRATEKVILDWYGVI